VMNFKILKTKSSELHVPEVYEHPYMFGAMTTTPCPGYNRLRTSEMTLGV
jgi:hypothetical protein